MSALTDTTATAARRPAGPTGKRVELARYTVPAGERIVYGQRVDGRVRVTDVPRDAGGRAYLIERGLEQDGNAALTALVTDYRHQAERLQEIPMATSLLERYLEHLP